MGLGADGNTCRDELKNAMRARLEAQKAGSGANVDLPDVTANFGAMGTGIFNILTVDASVSSDNTMDPAYWAWVSAVNAWISGVISAVTSWAPTQPAEQAVRTAILAVPRPPATPPTIVKGKIK
jgi:hypothetical protein